jgi:hypothetical protein
MSETMARFLKMCQTFFFVSTNGAPTLVKFCTNVWLNIDMLDVHVVNPRGNDDVWVSANLVEYTFVIIYYDMSLKFFKEYFN